MEYTYWERTRKFVQALSGLFSALLLLTLMQLPLAAVKFSLPAFNFQTDVQRALVSSNDRVNYWLADRVWEAKNNLTALGPKLISAAYPIAEPWTQLAGKIWQRCKIWFQSWQDFLTPWWRVADGNWRSFLGLGLPATSTGASAIVLDAAAQAKLEEQLRAEIRREVEAALKNQLPIITNESAPTTGNDSATGLITIPVTGKVDQDRANQEQVKNMFSDPVKIKLDASNRAGIVTPIFKSGTKQDYWFLLTPIKQ